MKGKIGIAILFNIIEYFEYTADHFSIVAEHFR